MCIAEICHNFLLWEHMKTNEFHIHKHTMKGVMTIDKICKAHLPKNGLIKKEKHNECHERCLRIFDGRNR